MYGRARRIALVKNIAIVLICIFVGYFVVSTVFKTVTYVDPNQNFAFLKNYFVRQGYTCEIIERTGGRCYIQQENNYTGFIRYDNGFNYAVRTASYSLEFDHSIKKEKKIIFRTNQNALDGYQRKEYYCKTKGSVIDELVKCETGSGDKLDLNTYIGVIEQGIIDLNKIIDASGYDKETLINDYYWEK